MGRLEQRPQPATTVNNCTYSTATQELFAQQLAATRRKRLYETFAARPLDQPPFGVVAAVKTTTGYSPENRHRINQDPLAMVQILQEEGSLCETVATGESGVDPELVFAISGSPYTDPRDSTTEHFMAFFHNPTHPRFYTLEDLTPTQIGMLVQTAHTFIDQSPRRRMAGINIGTQGETGVCSSQGWKNTHLQCFSLPEYTNRHTLSEMDAGEREYVEAKIPAYRTNQRTLRDTLALESEAFFGDGGRIRVPEEPDMFDVFLPEAISAEYIGAYIQLLNEYMTQTHDFHHVQAFAGLTKPWPTRPLMTIGFAKQHGCHAMRIAVNSAPGGAARGVAESLGVWPRRPSNNGTGPDAIAESEMATARQWNAFVQRTAAAAHRVASLTHQMLHDTQ